MEIIKYNTEIGDKLIEKMLSRSQLDYGDVQETVDKIVSDVRANGDKALFEYTLKFDKATINSENVKLTDAEVKFAYDVIDKNLLSVITHAIERIEAFHSKQKQNSWFDNSQNGEFLGQIISPIESVGVYVPGGKAAYPSTVIMNVIPAKVAGVTNIIMVTPPNAQGQIDPVTIVAAKEAGVSEIYKIGGAQAVAALAFGTQTIKKVDKIVGPGNIYVTLAKRAVFGFVSIDAIAGPSEILVIADETAKAEFVAADMLSQAEHDELACAILITTSETLAANVQKQLKLQTETLARKDIIEKSLTNYGAIVLVENLQQAADISNKVAPEHLEICCSEPFAALHLIKNAGAIFLGNYTPEPLGDYMAGPNHVLPTGGTARFFSPLSVEDFTKKSSILSFTKDGLTNLAADVISFANAEGLTAHANSVRVRVDHERQN